MSEKALTVLITGGIGYVGSHVCAELISHAHKVVIVDNLCNSDARALECLRKLCAPVEFVFERLDIRETDALAALLRAHAITAVVHCAGLKSVADSCADALGYWEANVASTISLLRAIKAYNERSLTTCTQLVFSSSATVYGRRDAPFHESARIDFDLIQSPYGRTKAAIERLLLDCAGTVHVTILRYFNPIGAHASGLIGESTRNPTNLMPCIINAVKRGRALSIYGKNFFTRDGTCERDYVHVQDLAVAHRLALERNPSAERVRIFNVGRGCGVSVLELVDAFERVNNVRIIRNVAPRREGDVAWSYCDCEKIRKELGWQPQRTLEDMCRDAWKYACAEK